MKLYEDFSKTQKRWAQYGALVFLLLINLFVFAVFVLYGTSAWRETRTFFGERLQVSLQGEGRVSAKPDVAKLTATILTDNASLIEAQKENSQRSNAVIGFLKKGGIAERDIKTTGYNIFPQYSYPRPCVPGFLCPLKKEDDRPRIVGYQVRNTLEITIRDTGRAGEILSGIVTAGANEVSNLQFTTDDPEELKNEARKIAVDDARAKAERLAVNLGKRVGKIVGFNESGSFPPPIFFGAEAFGKGGDVSVPEIQPGQNEIMVNVTVTYEFK